MPVDQRKRFSLALEHLFESISRGITAGGTRLPPIKTLAAEAGVSADTMYRAVKELTGRGVLAAKPGKGITILAPAGPRGSKDESPLPGTGRKFERLARQVQSDLVARVIPLTMRELPSLKELASRYGVTNRTMRKALALLVACGRLEEYGRGTRVPEVRYGRNSETSVILIARGSPEGALHTATPFGADLLRLFEDQAQRAGIRLRIWGVRGNELATIVNGHLPHGLSSGSVLGYLCRPLGLPWDAHAGLLRGLMTEGKPVAVLGEPHPIPPELERCGDRLRVVGIDLSPASGARVAQYLLRLGHRRIAYIDPTNGSPNAVFRLRGLEREFDAAGIADAVRTISYTTPPLREHGPHTEQQNLMRGISALASELSAAPRTLIGGELSSLLGEQLSHAQRDIQSRAASVEHFDRLLNDPTITAWVGFNDQIALAALDYLDAHKVPVPRRISVLGFDDSFESFARGMTSYDFNLPVCVQTMLKHVLHWSKNRGPKQRIIREEIPGFIKIRGTVAPPPA